jgi:dihydropteroate synthase
MFTLNCRGRLLAFERPVVMGIINATPDSFYPGSRHSGPGEILHQAERMIRDGAAIIDIGGQSTRPGSGKVTAEEEIQRVLPAIEAVGRNFPEAIISVDTFYSIVAREAVEAGASIVNDVSAGAFDPLLVPVVASLKVPYVLMHMKGSPQNMQESARYEDVTKEVLDFLIQKIKELRNVGIHDVIIDPGFGFAKTIAHNFELLRNLEVFRIPGCPVLFGISRKSTVYKTLGVSPGEALNGTTVLNTIGLLNGADILRVHDVREAMEAIRLIMAFTGRAWQE